MRRAASLEITGFVWCEVWCGVRCDICNYAVPSEWRVDADYIVAGRALPTSGQAEARPLHGAGDGLRLVRYL